MEAELIERAISEIEHPTLESTKEYLALHTVSIHHDTPRVERIDFDSSDYKNTVYFAVVNEGFFIVANFSKEYNELMDVSIENGNSVYITATSEEHNFGRLAETTKRFKWKGWSKGDLMPNGRSKYSYSRVTYGPIKTRSFPLEIAMKLLLSELEKDERGVQELSKVAEAQIAVNRDLYISSVMGFDIGSDTIKRINRLNLNLEFDQYMSGNPLLDEE